MISSFVDTFGFQICSLMKKHQFGAMWVALVWFASQGDIRSLSTAWMI